MKTPKDFASKKEFFQYLVANKKELIEFKKSALKFTDPFSFVSAGVTKSLVSSHTDDVEGGSITRTIVGNTYLWMDSHDDVHLENVFSKSLSGRQDKIWHLHDHEQKITAKVGRPQSIYEKSIDWKDLGVEIDGKTTALLMDSMIIKEYNPIIFEQYLSKEINQHSVGMQYILLDLAINDPEQKREFSTWNKVINRIGNKERAMDQGFFWAVEEAKLIEISCVLSGSNELTPTVENESKEKEEKVEIKTSFFSSLGSELKK